MFYHIQTQWKVFVLLGLFGLVAALGGSLLLPFEYESQVTMLVIHKQSQGFDPYLSEKAEERLAKGLTEIVFTTSFLNKVGELSADLPDEFFPQDAVQLKKVWRKHFSITSVPQTGILEISAYDTNPEVARLLSGSVANVLVTNGSEYHGAGDSIVLKIVDPPSVSQHPARPNLILNSLAGVCAGLLIAFVFSVFRQDTFLYDPLMRDEDEFSGSQVYAAPSQRTVHADESKVSVPRHHALASSKDYRQVERADAAFAPAELQRAEDGLVLLDLDEE